MTRREFTLASAAALAGSGAGADLPERFRFHRVPAGGLQPQVVTDDQGTVHLVYYAGDPHHGDLFYTRAADTTLDFAPPVRVNSQSGSAIAVGTIRGGQMALGRDGRIHVTWNGSSGSKMFYTCLNNTGNAFQPQRNLMQRSSGIDGGGSVAADREGNVYVAWHGLPAGKSGEEQRRVWVATSRDNGRAFPAEIEAFSGETGACGCCGMKIFADRRQNVFALYRAAAESVHRDIYVLESKDKGRSFQGRLLQKWEIAACPMSSMDIAGNRDIVVGAWETRGQVYWSRLNRGASAHPIPAPGEGKGRKHPRLAVNDRNEVLLVWTEGMGWQKGGSLACQLFDSEGRPVSDNARMPGVPAWSFAAVTADPTGNFSIFY